MAKITPVLWKHKTNSDGHAPIYLRIYAGGKTKYKSLGVRLHPRHWNGKQRRVRKSYRRHGQINTLISEKLAEAEGAVLERRREGKPVRARLVKQALEESSQSEEDFLAYGEEVVEHLEKQGQIATAKRYGCLVRKVRAFLKAKRSAARLPFDQITPQFLRAFETYGIDERGNKRTTVAQDLNCIRAILYRAIREGLARQEANPFFRFQIRSGTPERDRLTLGQIRRLEDLDLKKGSNLWRARSYFLFSFYCAGVRFADIALMERRSIVDGRLVYTMQKNKKERSVKLQRPARKIADYYLQRRTNGQERLFPILDGADLSTPEAQLLAVNAADRGINALLGEIADRAEIDAHVTFHVARHSFASIAQRRGWDVAKICTALGHSGLDVTERYLNGFDDTDLDDDMDQLFGGE